MASTQMKSLRLLATGFLLAVAGCQVSQQLSISVEHNNKQQQQQETGSYRARAPNDDLHLSAAHFHPSSSLASASASAFPASSYTNYKHQYHQQHDKQQQQQQRERALNSGRAVINGNHATYVEPPADFKPIIYEQPAAGSPTSTDSDAPAAELFDYSPNQLSVSSSPGARFQQQQQQQARYPSPALDVNHQISASSSHQQPQGFKRAPSQQLAGQTLANNQADDKLQVDEMTSGALATFDGASEQALDSNVLPLKPSIGRWSEWHDMSIEPDLAASDTQLEPQQLVAPGSRHQSKMHAPAGQRKSGLKTRYGGEPAGAIKSPGALYGHFHGLAALNHAQSNVHSAASSLANAPSESQRVHRQSASGLLRVLPLNLEESARGSSQPAFYAANLISLQQSGVQYANAPHWHHHRHHQQQQQQQLRYQHSDDYRRPSPLMISGFQSASHQHQQQAQQQQQQPLYLMSPAFLQTPPSPMHFLMAHNQQQQQQQQHHHPEFKPMPRSHSGTGEQPQEDLFVRRASQPSKLLQQPPVRQNAEVRLLTQAGRVFEQPGSQVSVPLISPKEAPRVFSLNDAGRSKPAAASQVTGSTPSLAPGAQALNKPLSRPTPGANSTGKPRVLKRRRIKTQLPVGLSSWMLGGIRDLDARHWRLPAEVVSKLVVNDVDLAHPEQPASSSGGSGAFSAFEDSTTDLQQPPAAPSALERAGPPLASSSGASSTQRTPSQAQQIPR